MKKNKKIILGEQQLLRLINEALSSTLFHWTSIAAAYKIFTSNRLFCQSALAGGGADNMSQKYKFYVSMARNKTNQEGFATTYSNNAARIEFNGDALNQNFAGHPVNYWGADELYNKWTYMRHASGVKNGSRLWYKEVDSIPQGVIPRKRDKFPAHPTPNSPEYIQIGNQYFQKQNDERNVEKSIGFKYTPIKHEMPNADIKDISKWDFQYPTALSPEYARFDNQLYHKEQSIPTSIQQHHENEMEDRLFTNKPYIDDIRQYIKRIDLLVTDWDNLHDNLKRIVYNFALRCQSCFIYDNSEDFNHQTDNTINDQIKNIDGAYDKFGDIFADKREGSVTDVLGRFLGLITLPIQNNPKERNQIIAQYLKQGGFEDIIRPVLKKVNNIWGNVSSIISDITIDIQNISKAPTQKGQDALKLITHIFSQRGYKNWKDVAVQLEKELNPRGHEFDNIDTSIKKERQLIVINGYEKFDVTNDEDTNFWHIFRLDNKQERYYFIESLIDNLNYATNGNWETTGEWINNVRDKSKIKFQKYLQHLAHRQVTLSQMFNLFNKLGYSTEQLLSDFGWTIDYQQETFDYWSYAWSDVRPPFKGSGEYISDDREDYAKLIFRKDQL